MRPLRVAIGGLSHETNTFALGQTGTDRMEAAGLLRGEAIRDQHATAETTVAGFLELDIDPDVELVPLLFCAPNPSGLIAREAFERVVGELLGLLAAHRPWDAVLLALHGAAVADGVSETDAEIVWRVRALVGPRVPIGVTLDMHANVSPAMVHPADIVTVYQTNPHVDARALMLASLAARRCAEVPELASQLEGRASAAEAFASLDSALGRGLFRTELFWIMDMLAKLGVIRYADLGDFTVTPHRIVRDTLFRLGFIASPYASDGAALTAATRAARRAVPDGAADEILTTFALACGCAYDCAHRKTCDYPCRERLE